VSLSDVDDSSVNANAPAALKKLDKNGDGKLTRDEIMPRPAAGRWQRQTERTGRRQNASFRMTAQNIRAKFFCIRLRLTEA